jgi:hypothetical protein
LCVTLIICQESLCVIFMVANKVDILSFKHLSEITEERKKFYAFSIIARYLFHIMCKLLSSEIVITQDTACTCVNTLSMYVYSYCSSMYSYGCLCILIVVYVFLDAATLTEVFRAFSSVVRQMPEYNEPRRGTARTLQLLCCSMYCLFCIVLWIVCV